jgi:tetratricopeptide (TPR) repeat protein
LTSHTQAGILTLSALLAACGTTPSPQSPSTAPSTVPGEAPRDRARRLNNEAKTAYELGDYSKAIASFKEAYEAYPHAQILYNLGQSYRLSGQHEQALNAYQAYLRNATNLADEDRSTVEEHIRELEKVVAAQRQSSSRPPTGVSNIGGGPQSLMSLPPPPTRWYESVLGWSVTGVGVAAVAGGTISLLSINALDDKRKTAPDNELPGIDSDIRTRRTLGVVLLAAAGVAIAAGVTIFILKEANRPPERSGTGDEPSKSNQRSLGLTIGPAGVGVHGNF